MTATLKNIAEKLNVSVSTVSRALQNHPRIGSDTKEKIKELAKKLDYIPNSNAINLKRKHTKTLGVIVPELSLHFFSEILAGMDEMAHKYGYNLLICQSNENAFREKEQLLNLYKSNVDGILVAVSKETTDFGYFNILRQKGFPIMFFSRTHPDFPAVISDDYKGAEMATQFLIKQGCKNIAHIAGPWHLISTTKRLNGYANALKLNDYEVKNEYIVYSELGKEDNIFAIQKILNLKNIPDAIFCFNDYVAYDVIQILKEKNIQIGKDILIIGYGNQPISQYIEPQLTSIDQQAFKIGTESIELVLKLIENKEIYYHNNILTLDTKLIIRNSTKNIKD